MKSSSVPGSARSAAIAACCLCAAALAACVQAGPPSGIAPPARSGGPAACDAGGAQFAIGQEATPALQEEARRRSGAARVRVIQPGQMVTLEFDDARLNLDVNAANRVVRARCG